MRVLVDTSVWSLALRRGPLEAHPAVARLRGLLEADQDIVLMGCILQEVLQGFRSEPQLRRVSSFLEPVPLLELVREDYVSAARLRRRCASRGIAATTIDCQIAAAAMNHGCCLLTADSDFERIRGISKLKLLQ